MRCAIMYHLYNKKKREKRSWRSVTFKPATLLKVTLLHGFFLRFLNCINGMKSRKTSHIKPLQLQEMPQCSLVLLPSLHET